MQSKPSLLGTAGLFFWGGGSPGMGYCELGISSAWEQVMMFQGDCSLMCHILYTCVKQIKPSFQMIHLPVYRHVRRFLVSLVSLELMAFSNYDRDSASFGVVGWWWHYMWECFLSCCFCRWYLAALYSSCCGCQSVSYATFSQHFCLIMSCCPGETQERVSTEKSVIAQKECLCTEKSSLHRKEFPCTENSIFAQKEYLCTKRVPFHRMCLCRKEHVIAWKRVCAEKVVGLCTENGVFALEECIGNCSIMNWNIESTTKHIQTHSTLPPKIEVIPGNWCGVILMWHK